jgi:hypothetical protein
MVAALASRRRDHRRDPRLFVLCTSGGGALHVYDFGAEGLLPVALAWDLQDPRILVVQAQVGGQMGGWAVGGGGGGCRSGLGGGFSGWCRSGLSSKLA